MRCTALCVLLLAISEPLLLVHAKVVLIVPRQVRRSPAVPWRSSSMHHKKASLGGNDFQRHVYQGGQGGRYYGRKPYRPLPYPHGGDDFDQGHESVNHVHIPYGKDVSHGISFGKGYIPYDNIKSSSLPFVHERYAGAYPRHQPAVPDYPANHGGFTSVGQEYATAATAHAYDGSAQHVDSFFSDMETAARNELRDSIKDTTGRYYAGRSIEKDLALRNQQALSGAVERDRSGGATVADLSKDASPVAYSHAAAVAAGTQGAVILPAGIPPATIAGNKDGIVLRDSVSLDDYHRKLEELTKAWPSVLTNGAATHGPATTANVYQPSLYATTTVDRFPVAGTVAGGGWLSSFAEPKQGYAVREDRVEPASHPDFRTAQPYRHPTPLGTLPAASQPSAHG